MSGLMASPMPAPVQPAKAEAEIHRTPDTGTGTCPLRRTVKNQGKNQLLYEREAVQWSLGGHPAENLKANTS